MTTRHTLTLSGKIQLIRENEEKFSYRTLADKYKISIGSVSNIIKRKAEYMENYEQNENSTKKRILRDEFSQLFDQRVYEWFVAQRSKSIPVSGPLLQERARQTRQQLGGTTSRQAVIGWRSFEYATAYNIESYAENQRQWTLQPLTSGKSDSRR